MYVAKILLGKNTFCPARLKLSLDRVSTQARLSVTYNLYPGKVIRI